MKYKIKTVFNGTNWNTYYAEVKTILEGIENERKVCLWQMANGMFFIGNQATLDDLYIWKCLQANIKTIILQSVTSKEKLSLQNLETGTEVWQKLCRDY